MFVSDADIKSPRLQISTISTSQDHSVLAEVVLITYAVQLQLQLQLRPVHPFLLQDIINTYIMPGAALEITKQVFAELNNC